MWWWFRVKKQLTAGKKTHSWTNNELPFKQRAGRDFQSLKFSQKQRFFQLWILDTQPLVCPLDRILLQALIILGEIMRRCRGCCFDCLCLLAVCEMKSPSMSDFLTGLENSGWLRHIKAVMDAGVFLAKVKLLSSCSCVPKCLLVCWGLLQVVLARRWCSGWLNLSKNVGWCSCWANTNPVSCIVPGLYEISFET